MAFSSIPAREFQSLYDNNVARAHHNTGCHDGNPSFEFACHVNAFLR
jgi:hypothetical protein